jgi:hypothetical protein
VADVPSGLSLTPPQVTKKTRNIPYIQTVTFWGYDSVFCGRCLKCFEGRYYLHLRCRTAPYMWLY